MTRIIGTPASRQAAKTGSRRSLATLITSTPSARSRAVNSGSSRPASAGVTYAVSRTGASAPVKPRPDTSRPRVSPGTWRPTAAVLVESLLDITSGQSRLFHWLMNLNTARVAMAGTASGTITRMNVCQRFAPSSRAASS